jgi:hypothetical protein
VFWIGDQLGAADLSSGQVVLTARLPMPAYEGRYSHDGATFAYRASVDPVGSISTRIDGGGYDRELYLQAPIGGHGGPPPGAGPVFMSQTIVWSNEQKIGQCGPGGESGPDGVILALDMGTGRDSVVDTTQTVPGIGGPPLPLPSTGYVLDVWF